MVAQGYPSQMISGSVSVPFWPNLKNIGWNLATPWTTIYLPRGTTIFREAVTCFVECEAAYLRIPPGALRGLLPEGQSSQARSNAFEDRFDPALTTPMKKRRLTTSEIDAYCQSKNLDITSRSGRERAAAALHKVDRGRCSQPQAWPLRGALCMR